jgi:hypothetical protein
MYPILLSQPEVNPTDNPSTNPFCYLSPLPMSELHPNGTPPGIGPATDPLLEFSFAYFLPPDKLVLGGLHCSTDVPDFFPVAKPYFRKLAKWISANWKTLPGGQFYIAPEVESLLANGARLVNFPPGVEIEVKVVPDRKRHPDDSPNGGQT